MLATVEDLDGVVISPPTTLTRPSPEPRCGGACPSARSPDPHHRRGAAGAPGGGGRRSHADGDPDPRAVELSPRRRGDPRGADRRGAHGEGRLLKSWSRGRRAATKPAPEGSPGICGSARPPRVLPRWPAPRGLAPLLGLRQRHGEGHGRPLGRPRALRARSRSPADRRGRGPRHPRPTGRARRWRTPAWIRARVTLATPQRRAVASTGTTRSQARGRPAARLPRVHRRSRADREHLRHDERRARRPRCRVGAARALDSRVPGHHVEWLDAIKGPRRCASSGTARRDGPARVPRVPFRRQDHLGPREGRRQRRAGAVAWPSAKAGTSERAGGQRRLVRNERAPRRSSRAPGRSSALVAPGAGEPVRASTIRAASTAWKRADRRRGPRSGARWAFS